MLKDEPAANGELFPHVHGPIPPDAVIEICPVRRGGQTAGGCSRF